MMLVIDAKNRWGSAGSTEVLQRADLWQVDFSGVVGGLNTDYYEGDAKTALEHLDSCQAKSVSLPQKVMKSEPVRRDSRSYSMPSFDEPLEASKVVFWFSSKTEAEESEVYRLLDRWWNRCRAGRGSVAGLSALPSLDANYKVEFRWDVPIRLLKGVPFEKRTDPYKAEFGVSTHFVLVKAWLSGFKVSDLSYEQGNQIVTVEATLQAESLESTPG